MQSSLRVKNIQKLKELVVIGLNSGTSMDGVDAAAFKINPDAAGKIDVDKDGRGVDDKGSSGADDVVPPLHIEMIGSLLYEFEPFFGRRLKKLVASGYSTLDEICRLDWALGSVFGEAACKLMRSLGLTRQTVDLIGSHGQTIWHAPQEKTLWGIACAGSMQLGQPAVIAGKTGVKVISDFRPADIAAGGQGAPLTPFADQVLFGPLRRCVGVLNLGGIANITILNKEGHAALAYDAGPGLMLIDRASANLFGCSYDQEGKIAAGGKVNEQWLTELQNEKYYRLPPPKTTGRELFGYNYADKLCEQALRSRGLPPADVIATLTALTASVVAGSYAAFVAPDIKIEELILGGGGSQNKYLREMLVKFWPHSLQLRVHEDFGISSKFKESLLFALLAYTSFFGIPNNVPACTGAYRSLCLGRPSWTPC